MGLLQEYDRTIELVAWLDGMATDMRVQAAKLEESCYAALGLEFHNRDPGFPGWSISGLSGYYNTPREALQALSLQSLIAKKQEGRT